MVQLMSMCCLLVIIFISMCCQEYNAISNNDTILQRKRRYLLFPQGARSGIRVNFKHNRVVPITTILAYSDGMRLTWDLPTKLSQLRPKERAFQRRDVFEFLQQIISGHGLDGEACVMRALCEAAAQNVPGSGLIKKILHRIFTIPEEELLWGEEGEEQLAGNLLHARSHGAQGNSCHSHFAQRCPFSLLGPSVVAPFHETHPRD